MNAVLTIVCFALASCTSANPAYNYQQLKEVPSANTNNVQPQMQPIQQNYVASVPAAAPQFISQPINVPAAQGQYVQTSAPASIPQFVNNPASQYIASIQQQGGYNPQQQQAQQTTIVSKDIYIHSAPEETEEIGNVVNSGGEGGPIRKNYRIIFVKAPVHNIRLNLESLKRAQAANEEKTIIYVLSKKPDIANIQSQLVNVQSGQTAHKPEVYFIKYKTQEEANRAQQEIKAQYDALGGATNISDEGLAPVTSVIGGASVNVGSVAPAFATSVSNNSPSFASNLNFMESGSSNQQQYVQSSLQGNNAAASSPAANFAVESSRHNY